VQAPEAAHDDFDWSIKESVALDQWEYSHSIFTRGSSGKT